MSSEMSTPAAIDIALCVLQVWQDGVSTDDSEPVVLSEWNADAKLRVNAWQSKSKFRAFDLANAGYQVITLTVFIRDS